MTASGLRLAVVQSDMLPDESHDQRTDADDASKHDDRFDGSEL